LLVNGGAATAYNALGQLYYTSLPTSFGYDGGEMIEEFAYQNGFPIVRRFVHGPGTDEPLVWYEGSGTSDRRFHPGPDRMAGVGIFALLIALRRPRQR
jgi:hypothetical protein